MCHSNTSTLYNHHYIVNCRQFIWSAFLSNIFWGNIFPYPNHVSGDKATKDMAEIYGNVSDALKKDEDKNDGK